MSTSIGFRIEGNQIILNKAIKNVNGQFFDMIITQDSIYEGLDLNGELLKTVTALVQGCLDGLRSQLAAESDLLGLTFKVEKCLDPSIAPAGDGLVAQAFFQRNSLDLTVGWLGDLSTLPLSQTPVPLTIADVVKVIYQQLFMPPSDQSSQLVTAPEVPEACLPAEPPELVTQIPKLRADLGKKTRKAVVPFQKKRVKPDRKRKPVAPLPVVPVDDRSQGSRGGSSRALRVGAGLTGAVALGLLASNLYYRSRSTTGVTATEKAQKVMQDARHLSYMLGSAVWDSLPSNPIVQNPLTHPRVGEKLGEVGNNLLDLVRMIATSS